MLLLLLFSTVLGFTLYEDRGDGRAAKHQFYSSAKVVWYAPIPDMYKTDGNKLFALVKCMPNVSVFVVVEKLVLLRINR